MPALPTGLPAAPGLPAPGIPTPSLPGVPGLPIPTPSLPGVPGLPVSGLPALPALPVPTSGLPKVPALPTGLPTDPTVVLKNNIVGAIQILQYIATELLNIPLPGLGSIGIGSSLIPYLLNKVEGLLIVPGI